MSHVSLDLHLNLQSMMNWGGPSNVSKCQKMSSCQKDVKCQRIKHLNYGGGSLTKSISTMSFTDIDINFNVTYDGQQKTLDCPNGY